jgi:hypothetical protein
MIRYLVINDYNTCTTDIIVLDQIEYNKIDQIHDYISELGYNLKDIEFMISESIEFKQI